VDFNNEKTIGTPAIDVERINILGKRDNFLEALEHYHTLSFRGAGANINVVRSRMITLFLQLYSTLRRHFSEEEFNNIKHICGTSKKEEELIEQFSKISDLLDKLRITRLDTKKVYDSTNVEAENKEKGY